ncbi:MAG TPA: hypothetical protein VIL01_11785 [Thermomicrobiales bacterium]
MTPVEYYTTVAERMLPFLSGRKVAVEQRFRDGQAVYRRHAGHGKDRRPIRIETTDDIVRWAKQHVLAFHGHIKPEGPGAWFFLDIDSRELPTEMARIGALHALDLITEQRLQALVKYSGSDGFHLMWEMPDLRKLGRRSLWDFEQALVEALAARVGERLETDERAAPIRDAVGPDGPLVVTNALREDPKERAALLFDKLILKPNANARVPYSLHVATGLVSVPLTSDELETFDESLAEPERVAADERRWTMPRNDVAEVQRALEAWTKQRTA